MFTFSFSTAFAVGESIEDLALEKMEDELDALADAMDDYQDAIVYTQADKLVSAPGLTTADTNLTQTAIEKTIADIIADYNEKIEDAVDDVDKEEELEKIAEAWTKDLSGEDDDAKNAAKAKAIFETYADTLYDYAVEEAIEDAEKLVDDTDAALYMDEDGVEEAIETLEAAIEKAEDAVDKTKTDAKALETLLEAIDAFEDVVDGEKITEAEEDLDEAIEEAEDDIKDAAEEYLEDRTEALEKIIDDEESVSEVIAAEKELETLEADVEKVEEYFLAQLAALDLDDYKTSKEALEAVDGVVDAAETAFGDEDEFAKVMAGFDDMAALAEYAEELCDAKKVEYSSTTGLAKYNATTVDEYLADIIDDINAGKLKTYKAVREAVNEIPEAEDEAAALKNKIEDAIEELEAYKGADKSGWYDEDAVEEVIDEYAVLIKAVTAVSEIEDLVDDAKDAMDLQLTTKEAKALTSKVTTRLKNKGWNSVYEAYAEGIAAADKNNDYDKALDAVVDAAKQVVIDAALATLDTGLTNSEIDVIISDNYEAALAVIDSMKTDDELEAMADEIEAAIKALSSAPTLETAGDYLAVQEMIENYMDEIGAETKDISNFSTFKTYMKKLVKLEKAEVESLIKKLPSSIDSGDKAVVEAARAAADLYEDTYGAYDADGTYNYGYAKATNIDDLEDDEKALDNAMMVDAAKAIAAIPAVVTVEDAAVVEAARAAYDALSADAKELFDVASAALVDKLEAAEATLEVGTVEAKIADVESLKIKASSTKGKGWIKVQWKVTGNAEAADGYQLYKSTKAQTGYKKCITTTKTSFKNTKNLKAGTRYYYKVRAYVVVDGTTYYSDWSNKANRIAK